MTMALGPNSDMKEVGTDAGEGRGRALGGAGHSSANGQAIFSMAI